jgi:hypothetical protein
MTTTFSDSALSPQTPDFDQLKAFVEPGLVLSAGLFWIAALPLVALSLLGVKIWDTLLALASGSSAHPIRRGLARNSLALRNSSRAAQI